LRRNISSRLELLEREAYGLAVERHLVAFDVHPYVAGLDHVRDRLVVLATTQHGPDARDQLAMAERLRHVVVGADLQPDHLVDLRVAGGDHDHGHAGVLPQLAAHLNSGKSRQHEVEQHDVRAGPGELVQACTTVGRSHYLVPLAAQHVTRGLAVTLLVLDEQHTGHEATSWSLFDAGWSGEINAGNLSVKVDPLPTLLHTDTDPPCASVTSLTIDRPRPVPPEARLLSGSTRKNRSKIRS